jgi:hypothetical protein
MTIAAAVKYTQNAVVGSAGVAYMGVTGLAVTVANGDDTGVVAWKFEVLDVPIGSSVPTGVVQSGITATWTFTPDVAGGYLVRITVTDALGNTVMSIALCFGVLEATGRFVPPFAAIGASVNFTSQARGWAKYVNQYLKQIDLIGGTTDANTAVTMQPNTDWQGTPRVIGGKGLIQTTNNTPADSSQLHTITSGKTCTFYADVVATQTAGAGNPDSAEFQIKCVIRNDGGVLTQVMAPAPVDMHANTTGTAWFAGFVLSGAGVKIEVTGDTGKNVDWTYTFSAQEG